MEIKIGTKEMIKVLTVITWIIFIGLCIQAGGLLFNSFYTLLANPSAAKQYWQGVDLSSLYQYDKGAFLTIATQISIVAILKALLFYLILKILHNKKLSLSKPFDTTVRRFILNTAYVALGISLFAFWGTKYILLLQQKSLQLPSLQDLNLAGADVWLFMCVILFVLAQIFKRGIDIQSENDLTI